MNSKRILLSVGIFVIAAILLVTIGKRLERSGAESNTPAARTQSGHAKQKRSFSAEKPAARRGLVVDHSVLSRRFSLSDAESSRLRGALLSLGVDWMEQKGSRATATLRTPQTLIVRVPALKLTDDQIESAVLTKMGKAVGIQKASAIWDDPDGKQTVFRELDWDRIRADTAYTFTKTAEEHDVEKISSLGYAKFDVTYSYEGENPAGLGPSHWLGFTYDNATILGLGWNALAKAPVGYFRSEPLLGVASRPEPMPFVYHEKGSNTIELVDGLSPGSRETIKVP